MELVPSLAALGAVVTYTAKSALFTAGTAGADRGTFFDNTGTYTITLAAAATCGAGWHIWVRNVSGTQTIDPDGAELINGAATYAVSNAGDIVMVVCTGSAFVVHHVQRPSTVAITGGTVVGLTSLGVGISSLGATVHTIGTHYIQGRAATGSLTSYIQQIGSNVTNDYDVSITADHGGLAVKPSLRMAANITSIYGQTVKPSVLGDGSARTATSAIALFIENWAIGSNASITNNYGINVESITNGTNKYGVYIAGPSGDTAGTNTALHITAPANGGAGTAYAVNVAGGIVTIGGTTDTSGSGTGIAQIAGGLFVAKTIWTNSSVVIRTATGASDTAGTWSVLGDAVARFLHQADGKMLWGDGTNARDTNLYRSAADTLKTDDNFAVAATTASTSSTTGALVVSGGVGIAGATIISSSGLLRVGTDTSGGGSELMTIGLEANTASAVYMRRNATTLGGFCTANSLFSFFGGTSIATHMSISSGGDVTVHNTTASTSVSTGALIVNGGLGVAGQITFNGNTGVSLRVTNGVANATVATTLGSVGPTGSTAGDPQGWLRISVAGTDRYIPFW